MDGWMDGWMDGREEGRLKNKHKENRVFTGFSEKLESHFLACSVVMNKHCRF